MKLREKRRAATHRVCLRQAREYLAVTNSSYDTWQRAKVPGWGTRSAHCWAKRHAFACGCRGHQHGRPKMPEGICKACEGGWRPAVQERIRGRRELRELLAEATSTA